MPLVRGECAGGRRKDLLEMFERLPQRITLRADRCRVFAADQAAPCVLPVPTPADQAVDCFQGEGQAEEFCGGFDCRPREEFAQQRPQECGVEGVAR